jgi:hypothetical protein
MSYAVTTSVSVERTRAQIEKELRNYGADQFFSGWNANKAFISFRAKDRFVRFSLPLPKRNEKQFTHRRGHSKYYESWDKRSDAEALKVWEQACRTRWRALLLTLKAKLESIEAGIETFEQAFLAHIVLPDQTLVGDHIISALTQSYETGEMPALPPVCVAVEEDDEDPHEDA